MHISMLGDSFLQKIIDFIVGFFAFIPQVIYFIYASVASLLDFLQYIIRKLAGLDVYYVNGQPQSGDIVTSFIRGVLGIDKAPQYSALTTVFWSLVIFGCVLLVLTTIFQIIKSHYNYDSNKSNPINIIFASIKSLFTMAIVPIVAVFGFYLSNIVLQTLDHITSNSSESSVSVYLEADGIAKLQSGKIRETGEGENPADIPESYSSYDFFSFGSYTNTPTFSGVMFKIAGYNANRVRRGVYNANPSGNWDNCGVFGSSSNNADVVADQIDYAFANNLTLKENHTVRISVTGDDAVLASSYAVGYSALIYLEMVNFKSFSKFNVGLIWYYYNLWGFNFFLAFAGIAALLTLLVNIVFGLITRLIQLLALFLVFPPLIGIMPLDEGNAYKNWKKQFIADVLMVFGAVIGMNIFFLILPFINTISFFGNSFLDNIMNIFIMLAGLVMVKKFISLTSSFIGGSDATKEGEETRKGVSEVGTKALGTTMKLPRVGIAVGKLAPGMAARAAGWTGKTLISAFSSGKDSSSTGTDSIPKPPKMPRWERRLWKEAEDDVSLLRSNGDTTTTVEGRFEDLKKERAEHIKTRKKVALGLLGFGSFTTEPPATKPRPDEKSDKPAGSGAAPAAAGKGTAGSAGETTTEEKPKAPEAPAGPLKAFGKGVLDLGDAVIKLIADLTGASNAFASLEKAGVVDEAKTTLQSFYQAVGATDIVDAAENKKTKLSTKKQGENPEKTAVTKMRKDMESAATNMANMQAEIKKLIETVEKKK